MAAGAFAIALVGPLVVGLAALGPLERALVEREHAALVRITAVLAEQGMQLFEGDSLNGLGPLADARMSVLDVNGTVVADTAGAPGELVDGRHEGRRPEVAEAYTRPYGSARRTGRNGAEWLFVARRLPGDDASFGYVRAGRPLTRALVPHAILQRALALAALIAALSACIGIAWGAWQWFVPITALTSFARALARDTHTAEPPEHVGSFARLGRALIALDKQARRQIAALSKDDAQLRAILTSMVEGILAVDHEDRVVFANGAARTALGIEREPVGSVLWTLAPVVELEELVRAARVHQRPERREITSLRTGTERIFAMHASPFASDGRHGVVVVVQELTELRRLERVRRDFVANVSHELKTPLTAIGGYVDTILEGDVDPERVEHFLIRVQTNVARLRALVTDLLSLARIESGAQGLELVPVDWNSVVDGVLRRQEDAAAKKGLVLERTGAADARVLGDREAMIQVLENLVGNAVQYTPGPGRVRVEVQRRGERVVLAVEDTGMGIPAEDQERIFERFYRVDKARSREVGGTGLGLSIVKNLVRSMHGNVRVSSSLGRGTRFEVELPAT